MGASNRLQDLDPALLRPGRFDRQILVSPPDLPGREAILHVHTRGKPLAADVDLTGSPARPQASPAQISPTSATRRPSSPAARTAVHPPGAFRPGLGARHCGPSAAQGDVREGEAHPGLPRGRPCADVASHGRRLPVQKATIVPRGNALGYTFYLPEEERYLHTKEEFIDWMKIALAGRAAEQVVFGRVTNGAANDLEKVTDLARAMVFEYGMSEESPHGRCGLTTTHSRRRRSGCATRSRPGSLTTPTTRRSGWSPSTAPRSTVWRRPAREGDARARRAAGAARRRSSRSPAHPRPWAPCARCRRGRGLDPPVASAAVRRTGFTISAWRSRTSTRPSRPTRGFGAELEHRALVEVRVSKRPPCSLATVASSCCAAGRGHARRQVPRQARARDAPCRLRGRRRALGARPPPPQARS